MSEEAVHIRVTGKQLGLALAVVVAALSSYPLANWFSPSVRNDPFTGEDGAELTDRIELVELEITGCQRERILHNHSQAAIIATLQAKTRSNEYLIKQCMRVTGQ